MDEKDLPFPEAPFGIASLECAFATLCDTWRKRGKPIALARLLNLLTSGPASVLPEAWQGLGALRPGARADLVVVDTELVAQVSVSNWKSKARLTPWEGSSLTGWPVMSFVDGRLVFDRSRE